MINKEIERLDAARSSLRKEKEVHRVRSSKRAALVGYEPSKPSKFASDEAKAAYETAKAAYEARIAALDGTTKSELEKLDAEEAEHSALRGKLREDLENAREGFRKAVNAATDSTIDHIQLGALACLMQAESLSGSRIRAKLRAIA